MDNSKISQIASIAEIYRFLAQTMRYPDKVWMEENFFKNFFQLAEIIPDIQDTQACQEFFTTDPNWLESLQSEYTRLFINAHPHVIAPPYGSMYQSSGGREKRDFADATFSFYQQKGFSLEGQSEPPDWLVHQIEFMAVLAVDDNDGLENFIAAYFRPWYPSFKKRVERETVFPYFILTSQMIDFFTI